LKYDRPEDHIQNSLYFEIKTFLPGLLMVGDKLAMANGLEERFPFLDNDLIEFAQKIPVRHKLGNLEKEIKKIDENIASKKKIYREFDDGKNVLRKAMLDFMPEEILNRKKQGFSAPDENWYRKENREFIANYLLNSNARIHDIVSPDYIRGVLEQHNSGKINHRLIIWSFLNLESWLKQFYN
jgi:asparagine synthase (glutamine-hydrolysing)